MGNAARVPGGGGKLVVQKLGTVGQGGYFSVKSMLPDMYDKLTISNIWVEPLTAGVAANTNSNVRGDLAWTFSKSYDPNTGILKVSTMWGQLVASRLNGGLTNMTVYAVYCN